MISLLLQLYEWLTDSLLKFSIIFNYNYLIYNMTTKSTSQ